MLGNTQLFAAPEVLKYFASSDALEAGESQQPAAMLRPVMDTYSVGLVALQVLGIEDRPWTWRYEVTEPGRCSMNVHFLLLVWHHCNTSIFYSQLFEENISRKQHCFLLRTSSQELSHRYLSAQKTCSASPPENYVLVPGYIFL